MPDRHPDQNVLRELEPAAERLLNRHLSMAMHHREQFAEAPRAVGPLLGAISEGSWREDCSLTTTRPRAAVQPAALGGPLSVPPPNADLAVGQKPMLGTCVIRELVEARTRESAT